MNNYTLEDLSALFTEIQRGLAQHFGIHDLYIGGGSARAILDHVRHDDVLCMRDFDVFAVRHGHVSASVAEEIGKRLQSPSLGAFSDQDLRPRKRGHDYVAGWGFFFKHPALDVDLSVFHSFFDLGLNGLLDIDTIMIPCQESLTLLDVCDHIRSSDYATACENALIHDRYLAYPKYRSKTGDLIRWEVVEPDPIQIAIRIVRTFAKMDCKTLPNTIQLGLRHAIRHQRGFDRLQALRNLLKLLEDKHAAHELKMLQQLGVFECWLQGLDSVIATSSTDTLAHLFSRLPKMSQSQNSLLALAGLASERHRNDILKELSLQSPFTTTHAAA